LDAPGDAHWRAGVQKLQRANESFLGQLDAMLAYVQTPDTAEPRVALVQDAVESIPELEQAGEAARERPGGVILVVDDSQTNRELFHKFTTKEVADELFAHGFALGGRLVEATVMFCDIRSFTTIAELLPPDETIALLNGYFAYMMSAIETEGGIVNQIVGDGLMAIFGAPLARADHRERAVRAALTM